MPKKSKEIHKEHHHYNDDGSLAGINSIDVEKARKLYGYWDGIEAIIQAYTYINPQEMRQTVLENQVIRENNYGKFGEGKTKGIRHGLSIPHGLMHYLLQYDEGIFADRKNMQEFMRRFKGLRTCKEV